MGSSNALAAFRLYGGKVPPTSLNLLAYMALVSVDKDAEPWWSQGHEMLAIQVLGEPEPVTDAALRAVRRGITPLFEAGAITAARRSSGHGGRVIQVRYRLWLTCPAPDGNRPVHNGATPDGNRPIRNGGVGRKVVERRTKSGQAQDGNRPPNEYEEYEERDLKAGIPTPVDDTRTGSAREAEEAERKRQMDGLTELESRQDGRAACPRCGKRAKIMSNGYLKNHGAIDPRTGESACHHVRVPAAVPS
jgi:hypothetical protein